jgi:hypothetical protein
VNLGHRRLVRQAPLTHAGDDLQSDKLALKRQAIFGFRTQVPWVESTAWPRTMTRLADDVDDFFQGLHVARTSITLLQLGSTHRALRHLRIEIYPPCFWLIPVLPAFFLVWFHDRSPPFSMTIVPPLLAQVTEERNHDTSLLKIKGYHLPRAWITTVDILCNRSGYPLDERRYDPCCDKARQSFIYSGGELGRPCPGYLSSTSNCAVQRLEETPNSSETRCSTLQSYDDRIRSASFPTGVNNVLTRFGRPPHCDRRPGFP